MCTPGRATHSAHVRARKSKAGGHGSSLFSWGHLLGSRPAHNAAHKSQQGGMTHRHTHLSHNVSTNALVAHLEEGIEAIHLYTGGLGVEGCVSTTCMISQQHAVVK